MAATTFRKPTVNLVVLTYNRRDLLEKYMPSIMRAAKESQFVCRVTVLDNNSSDDSADFIRNHYPDAALVVSKANKVLCSYNDLAKEVDEEILILLNNDLELKANFVDPLIKPFEEDDSIFFVAPHGNRSIAKFRWGILEADNTYKGYEMANAIQDVTISAGVGAFHREKFLELGGYDELYLPGRYEDVDLCYRGWKKGWKGICEPTSVHLHEGGASFDKAFKWSETQAMVFRNSLLFMIKNMSDFFIWTRFLCLLPFRLAAAAIQGKWFIWRGFFQAIGRLPLAIRSRREAQKNFRLKDAQVIRNINTFYNEKAAPR